MDWSLQQESALKHVREWLRDRRSPQVFRLFGYAGTGKTTLARSLAEGARGRVLFGAFTGKAAYVMRQRGCEGARTIHSLIYCPQDDLNSWEPKFVLDPGSDVADAALVIIDECSMVGEDLARDLLSFGTKVLVLGDPAQLPPVKGTGYFISADPDVMLTEIHRQARDNPIIAMATTVREGGRLELGAYGASRVIGREDVDPESIVKASQVIVGLNRTRTTYNRRMRELLGYESPLPIVGDKLVCLRNDREKKLLNGSLWKVARKPRAPKDDKIRIHVLPEDAGEDVKPTSALVCQEFFLGGDDELQWDDRRGTQEFTFGYALTCHKSQGSQWSDTIVFDESRAFRDDAQRWLYTAVTRASERVTVVC